MPGPMLGACSALAPMEDDSHGDVIHERCRSRSRGDRRARAGVHRGERLQRRIHRLQRVELERPARRAHAASDPNWAEWPLSCFCHPPGPPTAARRTASASDSRRNRGPPARVCFHVFLGHGVGAAHAIEDRRQRPVREIDRDHEPLGTGDRAACRCRRHTRDRHGPRADHPAREVDEMTAFPQQTAAALFGLVEPVVGRQRLGAHSVEKLDRRPRFTNVITKGERKRGIASVEADEQRTVRTARAPPGAPSARHWSGTAASRQTLPFRRVGRPPRATAWDPWRVAIATDRRRGHPTASSGVATPANPNRSAAAFAVSPFALATTPRASPVVLTRLGIRMRCAKLPAPITFTLGLDVAGAGRGGRTSRTKPSALLVLQHDPQGRVLLRRAAAHTPPPPARPASARR